VVLVWLRGLRESRRKIDETQPTFPPPQPRARKIKPKSVRTLHEGGSKKIQIYFYCLWTPLKPFGQPKQVLLLGRRVVRILGAFVHSRACTPPQALAFHQLLNRLWPMSLDCLPCSLDCGWRRWETPLLVLSRPWQLCCIGAGRPSLYIEAAPFGVSPVLVRGTEALSFIWRASFGVCGLLALPNIHQIFGDNPVKFPRFSRDKAWVFSSWELYATEVFSAATSVTARLRTRSWGTQWGQLNRLSALLLLSALIERRLGALRRLLAWYNSLPSGGLPWSFGSPA
jgi:hypothetical protein